jgi:tetratricopeptide (TPR) repeat protein
VRFAHAGTATDRPLVISVLNQALRLADEFELPVGWTADAAYAFIEDSLWEDSLRPLVRLPAVTAAGALAEVLFAVTSRQSDGRRRTAEVLTALLESGLLIGDARDLAVYYAAEALREIGEGERTESMLRSLISRDSRIADLAVKGMVHRLRRGGRFTEALELIRTRPESGMWTQMTGTLYWSQGMLDEAKSAYEAARDIFEAEGRPGHAAEVSGCLAFVCGLSAVGGDDAQLVAAGSIILQQSRNTWAKLMARLGAALLAARGDAEAASQFEVIESDGRTAGLTSIEAYARFSRCLNAAISGGDAALLAARADLTELGAHDFRWLVEVVDFWMRADLSATGDGPTSDWLGGTAAARARWRRIIAARRHGLSA